MSLLDQFLQISELPDREKKLMKDYSIVTLSENVSFGFVNTFLILFLLEFITPIELGIVISIRFLVLAILDFPTGALGDYLGYRSILKIVYIFLICSALILAISYSFNMVVLGFIFLSIGMSQLSGAVESWFDNNYKDSAVDDDKQIYGAFRSRFQMIRFPVSALSFIAGGIIAELFSKRVLIFIYAFMLVITVVLVLKKITQRNIIQNFKVQTLIQETTQNMSQSLRELFANRKLLLLFLGFAINRAIGTGIWLNQLLFPIYLSYSKSDFLVGMLRAFAYLLGSIWVYFAPRITKRIKNEYTPSAIFTLIAYGAFYLLVFFYFEFFSPSGEFNLLTYLGMILLFHFPAIFGVLSDVMFSRIVIKEVPNSVRNGMYSLFSSLVTIITVPFAILGGIIIQDYGLQGGMILSTLLSLIGILIMISTVLAPQIKYAEKVNVRTCERSIFV